ncbi:hypothetical protein PG997_013552 [Apiospora hydei]|uniref:Uncharacterized protein n=1 Tax=Apiospora hydei TaxID=1337664 RepID=A0ABR1V6H5_9PEZI
MVVLTTGDGVTVTVDGVAVTVDPDTRIDTELTMLMAVDVSVMVAAEGQLVGSELSVAEAQQLPVLVTYTVAVVAAQVVPPARNALAELGGALVCCVQYGQGAFVLAGAWDGCHGRSSQGAGQQ